MKKIKLIGLISVFIGLGILVFNLSITGAVIGETYIKKTFVSILGLAFIIGGLVALLHERKTEEGKLVRIIRTRAFEKAIRKIPKKPIESTISKIRTGLGKEKRLEYPKGKWSIRDTKGARIIYSKEGRNVILEDYLSSHEYGRRYG